MIDIQRALNDLEHMGMPDNERRTAKKLLTKIQKGSSEPTSFVATLEAALMMQRPMRARRGAIAILEAATLT
jgi:hypothetical protein